MTSNNANDIAQYENDYLSHFGDGCPPVRIGDVLDCNNGTIASCEHILDAATGPVVLVMPVVESVQDTGSGIHSLKVIGFIAIRYTGQHSDTGGQDLYTGTIVEAIGAGSNNGMVFPTDPTFFQTVRVETAHLIQ